MYNSKGRHTPWETQYHILGFRASLFIPATKIGGLRKSGQSEMVRKICFCSGRSLLQIVAQPNGLDTALPSPLYQTVTSHFFSDSEGKD